MIYIVTSSSGAAPQVETSMRAARAAGAASYYTEADGALWGYLDRADMYADRESGHRAETVITPVRHPGAYIADEDIPQSMRRLVADAAGLEMPSEPEVTP